MRLPKVLLVLFAGLIATTAYAQGHRIKAILLDGDTGETLPFATISLIPEGADKPSKYVLSTSEGAVLFEGVRKGKYSLRIELMGYKTTTKNITVETPTIDLGKIKIETDKQMLEAAKVSDVGNPITVKKDTIEYNAGLFKTSENDMLIDLLKKLPGIEVESDGSITANGKTINKITIGGKTFFLDDPQLATKNIPSKIIEKVKVVDKKSDQAIFTGIDDGEEETVIDLSIKKGMMKGWFGNFMAGGGHDVPSKDNTMNDWRWQGAGFSGNFTDKSQISIVLNGNNTNNRGFNDLASNMMGNMRRGRGRNGGSGITTSWMGGVNGALTMLDGRMDLTGNYLYNGSSKYLEEESHKTTYTGSGRNLEYNTNETGTTNNQGHRVGMRLEHKFNKNTSIVFEPQFNYGMGNYVEKSTFETIGIDTATDNRTAVNSGFENNSGWNDNWTFSGRALLRQRLGKAGRTMTVYFNYNLSDNKLYGFNNSWSLDSESGNGDSVNQRFDQKAFNAALTAGMTYTEPLTKNWFLELNYRYSWKHQDSNKDTWDSGAYDTSTDKGYFNYANDGESYNADFSNNILNVSQVHKAGANVVYQINKVNVQLGFSAVPTLTNNITNGKEYNDLTINYAPQLSVRLDPSENSNLRLNYWGESNQPTTTQLMPVPDNSNPLNIALGNPWLKPYFQHSLRGMYRYTNKKTFTSINTFLDGGIVQNPISNTLWYEDGGVQFSMPTNAPTSYNANLRFMVNSPLGKSKFSIFTMTRFGYSNSSNYTKTGTLEMDKYYINGDKYNFNYDLFHADIPDLGASDAFSVNTTQTLIFMERLRLTFRCDLVEINLGGRTRMTKSWYTLSTGNTNPTWNNTVDFSMNWNIPGGVGLNADCNYNWYNGYTTEQPSSAILNVEITKNLWKDRFTLAVKGYDLLGMGRNINVSDTENYHQETINNTLGRYIILSLTYRFGNLNNARDRMKNGPGGPGGRPMGPPPGGMR